MEQTPSPPDWELALQSWVRFALKDLEAAVVASPDGLNQAAQRWLSHVQQDLQHLLQQVRDAVQQNGDCIDWSDSIGALYRITPAARARLADLQALGALPRPVRWPFEWAQWLERDANDPDGWRTPPTQPSTPRSPDDAVPEDGA